MATEQGLVTRIAGPVAVVKTIRTEACEGCAARDGCKMLGGGREVLMEVENALNAKPGDLVRISVSDTAFLKVTFLVYLIPAVMFLVGAIVGHSQGPRFIDMDPGILGAIAGFAFMALTFFFVRLIGNKMGQAPSFKPVMTHILAHDAKDLNFCQTPNEPQ
jgi:sigma-E factor negative regulatory protein RseC